MFPPVCMCQVMVVVVGLACVTTFLIGSIASQLEGELEVRRGGGNNSSSTGISGGSGQAIALCTFPDHPYCCCYYYYCCSYYHRHHHRHHHHHHHPYYCCYCHYSGKRRRGKSTRPISVVTRGGWPPPSLRGAARSTMLWRGRSALMTSSLAM